MNEKKANNFNSPDLTKLQAVIVDYKTTIYIPLGGDIEKAKTKYLNHMRSKSAKK